MKSKLLYFLIIINFYINRFIEIYPQTIITIPKGCKSEGLEKHIKEKSLEEFNFLKQNIDNDANHKERLDPHNEYCRYRNIMPYKDNKVEINSNHKYINASWVHIPYDKFFIATQGPLDTTIDDFWQMIYQYNNQVIIMLCNLEEKNKIKCADYWESYKINDYNLTLLTEFELYDGIILRNFELKKKINEIFPRTVVQLHYTCWEDHTAPDKSAFDKLFILMKFMNLYKQNFSIVTHCSAGVGRTGTFIAIFNLFLEIMKQINDINTYEIKFSVMSIVRKLKEMRLHLVENKDQYLFLYQFVDMLLKKYN